MPQHAFKCVISCTMTPFIDLQEQHVQLSQSGTTWTGTFTGDVGDTLKIAYTVTGITGSPWTVDITVDCGKNAPAKIFSDKGNIPHGGSEGHTTSAKVASDPCATPPHDAGAAVAQAAEAKAVPDKVASKKAVAKKAAPAKGAKAP